MFTYCLKFRLLIIESNFNFKSTLLNSQCRRLQITLFFVPLASDTFPM